MNYRLSAKALKEVADIVSHLHREVSSDVADTMEARLFAAFEEIADGKLLGHRRLDIPRKNLLFQTVRPYVVIFRRTQKNVLVVRVFHGARDIRNLL